MNKKSLLYLNICLFVLTLLFNPAAIKISSADIGLHEPSEWNWSTPAYVSSNLNGHSTYPSLATDNNGLRHVVWMDQTDYEGSGTDPDIFYSFGYLSQWSAPEVVSSTSAISASAQPDIAVDANGNVHVCWYDNEDYNSSGSDNDIFYRYKNATSGMWSTIMVVSDICTWDSVNVSIAIDGFNMVHFAWVDSTNYDGAGNDWDIFYRKYDFDSGVWYPIRVITQDSTGDSVDPDIVITPSKDGFGFWDVNIFWSDTAVNGEVISFANIYYRTWNALTDWSENTILVSWESIFSSTMPSVCVGPTNNIHAVWFDINDGTNYEIFYKRFDVKQNNWTNVEAIGAYMFNSSGRSPPSIAVDSADNVHVTWIEQGDFIGTGSDDDVYYRRLYTELNIWTTIEAVCPITMSTEVSSNPVISVDPHDNILILWDDFTDWDVQNDYDILGREFGRAPSAPELFIYFPPPGHKTDTGIVELLWSSVPSAWYCNIYRSNEFSIDAMNYYANYIGYSDIGYLMDTLPGEGIYYYVVEAVNAHGRTLSNYVVIEYEISALSEFTIMLAVAGGVGIIVVFLKKRHRKMV